MGGSPTYDLTVSKSRVCLEEQTLRVLEQIMVVVLIIICRIKTKDPAGWAYRWDRAPSKAGEAPPHTSISVKGPSQRAGGSDDRNGKRTREGKAMGLRPWSTPGAGV